MAFFGPERGYIPKNVKPELFKKQKGKCMYCGNKFTVHYLHIDHKTPVARNGGDRISNLQLLCSPCNTRKRDLTDGEFRRKYKLPGSRTAKTPPGRPRSQTYFDKITKAQAAKRAKRRRDDNWLI